MAIPISPGDPVHAGAIAPVSVLSDKAHPGETIEAWLRRALAGGMDTKSADEILDALFHFAVNSRTVQFTLGDNGASLETATNSIRIKEPIARGKTKIRLLCARLAVRCGEWAKRDVSPYGDTVDVAPSFVQTSFMVRFENTTSAQRIQIEKCSANP